MKKKVIAVMMGAILSVVALSGCNGKDTAGSSRGTLGDAGVTPADPGTEPENPGGDAPTPTQAADDAVYVDNVADLIEAIQPNAKIVVKPGDYNLSEYIQDVWDTDPLVWNKHHDYVEIREVYDGVELVVRDCEGLNIRGESDNCADAELVAEPRYAAVMTFDGCDKLVLSGLTMGHTDRGDCWGSVVELVSCDSVILDNMDLYGCGVIGINLEYCSNFLRCSNVTIRECSQGPLGCANSRGEWKFYNCRLVDSLSGGFFSETPGLSLYFEDCTFGDRETENFMFRDDTTVKNCTWGDPYSYPDYSSYGNIPAEIHKSDLTASSLFDEYTLTYAGWREFYVLDDVTGEYDETGRWAYFYIDGSGALYDNGTDSTFTWTMDSDSSAVVTMDKDSSQYEVTIYNDDNDQNAPLYMKMSDNSNEWWFFWDM